MLGKVRSWSLSSMPICGGRVLPLAWVWRRPRDYATCSRAVSSSLRLARDGPAKLAGADKRRIPCECRLASRRSSAVRLVPAPQGGGSRAGGLRPSWDQGPELASLVSSCDAVYLVLRPNQIESPEVAEFLHLIPHVGGHAGGYIVAERERPAKVDEFSSSIGPVTALRHA